jgi:exodeoxyribonuclease V alpha subunit
MEKKGKIQFIIYSTPDFSVAKLENGEIITLNRSIEKTDQEITFLGDFKLHPKYGKQFQAYGYYIDTNNIEDRDAIVGFLQDYIKGVGEKTACLIYDKFGRETFKVLSDSPERLREIEGIGKTKLKTIISSWSESQNFKKVLSWLSSHNVSVAYASKIIKEWGEEAISIIEKNPYSLTKIHGIAFITADKLAHQIVANINPVQRCLACTIFVLEDASFNGHAYLPLLELRLRVEKLIQDDSNKIEGILEQDTIFVAKEDKIYLKWNYDKEQFIKKELLKRVSLLTNFKVTTEYLDQYNEEQNIAIENAYKYRISIITGGGGVGKTYVAQEIAKLVSSPLILAPTGKAAQVISQKTSMPASTIHRGLGIGKNGHATKEINHQVVIIDESSMINLDLMFILLSSIKETCHIVFVGDPQQLPAIGCGNVLQDMIDSGKIPCAKLHKIYRTAAGSVIPLISRQVISGQKFSLQRQKDFEFVTASDNYLETIGSLFPILRKEYNLEDIQIISAMYKSKAGINELNTLVQSLYTSKNKSLEYGQTVFHIGDRVIQTENNYKKEVFNGDIGNIIGLNKEEKIITVKFDGLDPIAYEKTDIQQISLAWAITVHKFQGSAAKIIILPLYKAHFMLLSREWLYTAITRTIEKIYIIGEKEALYIALNKSSVQERFTSLLK